MRNGYVALIKDENNKNINLCCRAEPIGCGLEKLVRTAALPVNTVFREYDKIGFIANTQKFGFHSTVLEKPGCDLFPYFKEPTANPKFQPEREGVRAER